MFRGLRAAWWAFINVPDDTWVVTAYYPPLGLRIMHSTRSRRAAEEWNDKHGFHGSTVITYQRWMDYTAELWTSDYPWIEWGKIARELRRARERDEEDRLRMLARAGDRDITGPIQQVYDAPHRPDLSPPDGTI